MATVEQICALMEAWAPVRTQYSFDNSGLQTGDRCAEVSRVLVALDADEAVLKECVQKQAQLLITHHPLIFSPLRSVGSDTREGRLLMKAIRSGVAVYSSHTPLDGAEGGVNDELCRLLGVVPSAGIRAAIQRCAASRLLRARRGAGSACAPSGAFRSHGCRARRGAVPGDRG